MHHHSFTDGGAEVCLANYTTEQGEPTIQPSEFCAHSTVRILCALRLAASKTELFPSSIFFIRWTASGVKELDVLMSSESVNKNPKCPKLRPHHVM